MVESVDSGIPRLRWRGFDGEATLSAALSAAFWAWWARDWSPVGAMFVPMVLAFGIARHAPRTGGSKALVWILPFAFGGTFAAIALKLHTMHP